MLSSGLSLPLSTSKFTLHIALTNLPPEKAENFADSIKENLFEKYKKDSSQYLGSDKIENCLFNPLVYYIFGSYDIAFISLVDRFKFSQKLFVPPQNINENTAIGSLDNYDQSAFQIITGLCPVIKPKFNPKAFFESKLDISNLRKNRFVTICNLKLNNKLLIGNGSILYDRVAVAVHDAIRFSFPQNGDEHNYLIIQSFSWFELSIIFFSERLDTDNSEIAKAIGKLRSLTVDHLDRTCKKFNINSPTVNEMLRNSMYSLTDISLVNYKDVFLFSDSHSYIGFRKECLDNADDNYVERINSHIKVQVKPGYLKDFKKCISEIVASGKNAESTESKSNNGSIEQKMVVGRYDYVFNFKSTEINNNLSLINRLTGHSVEEDKIGKYVRKVNTVLLFDYNEISADPHVYSDFKVFLRQRLIDIHGINIGEINACLKKLKISRLIRGKVIKVFYNFINSIQDSILFIFLLDFIDFINYLKRWIDNAGITYSRKFKGNIDSENKGIEFVDEIENYLIKFIDIFQEGYQLRLLNSYQFEDINDFDLDFNSSPQQILSAYSSITREIQGLFFPDSTSSSFTNDIEYNFPTSPVIQINLKNTVADAFSINYDIFHLITPEFVFFTLVKEILNKYRHAKSIRSYKDILDSCDRFGVWIAKHKYFNTLVDSGLSQLDIDNIFIDYMRLGMIFQFDYKLFYTWAWTYNLQNAAMYESLGLFSEVHFKKELLRILIVGFLSRNETQIMKMECPLPELQIYWNRYYRLYFDELKKVFSYDKENRRFEEEEVDKLKLAMDHLYQEVVFKISTGNMTTVKGKKIDFKNDLSNFSRHCKQAFLHEKGMITVDLANGIPILPHNGSEVSVIYILQIIYTYLQFIYEGNGSRVNLLRRCWENGKPLFSFINKQKNNWYYNIDQMGGLFFTNNQKAREYFKIRNAMMVSLWHLGMILKKKHFFDK